MKRNYFVCCLLALFGSLNMQANDFTVDGINYTTTDSAIVSVVASEGSYTGAVNIPATVTYGDVNYKVTAIAEKAFFYCTGLTSVTIPENVTEIG